MLKYVLCIFVLVLILIDVIVLVDFKKYIKLHENELVENNIKGLTVRVITMAVISLLVGISGIVIQFM